MKHSVTWIDYGREPKHPPDPAYPHGKDVRHFEFGSKAGRACTVKLPYPAKRCGAYLIQCEGCGVNALVTTAGRPDDPRSVQILCRKISETQH